LRHDVYICRVKLTYSLQFCVENVYCKALPTLATIVADFGDYHYSRWKRRTVHTGDYRAVAVYGLYSRQHCSAGLRHVRSVRPNRAADFRGPPFWTL